MALTTTQRATIERWSGPILSDADAESRLSRLGAAEVVALEYLLATRAEMMVTTASRSAGDERYNHQANMPWIDNQIRRLIEFLANSDDVTLNAAAEDLLEAERSTTEYTRSIRVTADNRRRGG